MYPKDEKNKSLKIFSDWEFCDLKIVSACILFSTAILRYAGISDSTFV